tara:strand:- start:1100 stop:1957 length:858 start_codon:yes stop_codon:yes gene_type:complete
MKLKTPLRYPGGKSRVAKKLIEMFPDGIQAFREPFLGGGSTAIAFTQKYPDIPVWVNDKYEYLYNFWYNLQTNGEELSKTLVDLKLEHDDEVKARELFKTAKETISEVGSFDQSVLFWVLNKCSYSGLTENSSFSATASRQNFTVRGAKALVDYSELIQNWTITNFDYNELLSDAGVIDADYETGTFVFLDPPYKIKSYLYGSDAKLHKDFDHGLFAKNCSQSPWRWMVTYNIDDELSELFKNYHQEEFEITYGMQHRRNNRKKELLITNYDINPPTPIESLYGT